jgi:hypothetical protein
MRNPPIEKCILEGFAITVKDNEKGIEKSDNHISANRPLIAPTFSNDSGDIRSIE